MARYLLFPESIQLTAEGTFHVTADPTSYRCYRQYILDEMKRANLSYRSFSAKYSHYISFPFLSKLLRRDSKGEFTRDVNLRAEKLAALLKAMGVDQRGISHLVLCRLEGDKVTGTYKYSSAFSDAIKNFSGVKINSSYLNFIEGLENLLTSRRQKVIDELKNQIAIEISRSNSPLKTQKLKDLLEAL